MKYFGLDVGTAQICFINPRGQLIIDEPNMLIKNTDGKVLWGERALEKISNQNKSKNRYETIYPFKNSVIVDFSATLILFEQILATHRRFWLRKPNLVASFYAGASHAERQALERALLNAGFGDLILVPRSVLALLGSKVQLNQPKTFAIIETGFGSSELLVTCYGDITTLSNSESTSEDNLTSAIIKYIYKVHKARVTPEVALELIKSADSLGATPSKKHKIVTGPNSFITISSKELTPIFASTLEPLVKQIQSSLIALPSQALSDVVTNSIMLSGNLTVVRFIDKYLQKMIGIKISILPAGARQMGIKFIQSHVNEYKSSLLSQNINSYFS